jgi:hypothetical protein
MWICPKANKKCPEWCEHSRPHSYKHNWCEEDICISRFANTDGPGVKCVEIPKEKAMSIEDAFEEVIMHGRITVGYLKVRKELEEATKLQQALDIVEDYFTNSCTDGEMDDRYEVTDHVGESSDQLKVGDEVVYEGASDSQVAWGGNDDPRKVLLYGGVYVLRTVEVHSWHTKVELEGIIGKFNSVCFKKV